MQSTAGYCRSGSKSGGRMTQAGTSAPSSETATNASGAPSIVLETNGSVTVVSRRSSAKTSAGRVCSLAV